MTTKNKPRIMSQQPRNIDQISSKNKEKGARMLKKTSSLLSDCSSPIKLPYKNDVSTGKRSIIAHKLSDSIHLDQEQLPLTQGAKCSPLISKKSVEKMKVFPYNGVKSELYVVNMIGTKLLGEDNDQKMKIEVIKKPKIKKEVLFFTKGNNHQLLREIFINKYGFTETQIRENATFCWLQGSHQKQQVFGSSKSMFEGGFPQIGKLKVDRTPILYNYLQGQSQLTNKQKLFKNMKKYCPQSIGTYIPKSFIIDFRQDQNQVQQSLLQFISYYLKKQKAKKLKIKSVTIKNEFVDITLFQHTLNKLAEKSLEPEQISPHEQELQKKKEEALWILKPTSLNRGRGIHLFSNIKQLAKLLSQTNFQISIKMYRDKPKPKTYIVQQYISRPLLIDGFKFDMRFWVLMQVTKSNGKKYLTKHLFQHGYSRLASVKFESKEEDSQIYTEDSPNGLSDMKQMSKEEKLALKKQKNAYINNRFIHLTNNAVQKQAVQYGQFCQGNQLSIENTVNYFKRKDENCPITVQNLVERVKNIVTQSLNSVQQRLVTMNIPKNFQLLGYDFLLDHNYNLWFIEVNCNPCLEQSSQLVSNLLKKMLQGLVFLTSLEEGRGPTNSQGWIPL